MNRYDFIANIEQEIFDSKLVIPCLDENGFRSIIIKNKFEKFNPQVYSSKYLKVKKNTLLNNHYYCHIIICRENNDYINANFDILYNYLFKKIDVKIDENELLQLIHSLEELFIKPSNDIHAIQLGIAGELLTILYLYESGFSDIIDYYHRYNFSKHDIELSSKIKIEVKTTSKENRIHRFNHSQLNNSNFTLFISSVLLTITERGMTLFELFNIVKNLALNNFEVSLFLDKMMNYCNVNIDDQGIIFSYETSKESVRFYNAIQLPCLSNAIPAGISEVSYNINCEFAPQIELNRCDLIY